MYKLPSSGMLYSIIILACYHWFTNLICTICTNNNNGFVSAFATPTPTTPSSTTTIEYIAGQRCILQRASQQQQQSRLPPLVVYVGMAQTVQLWEHHIIPLSQSGKRDVLLYEPIGLGPIIDPTILQNVSIPQQAEKLLATINEAFSYQLSSTITGSSLSDGFIGTTNERPAPVVDLVGYSLGGRIAMAVACLQPSLVRKLHITGVGWKRTDYAYIQLLVWKQQLLVPTTNDHQSLQAFAWSAISTTYSPTFLRQNENRLPQWVDTVAKSHNRNGLLAIMEQASDHDESLWSVPNMAQRLTEMKLEQNHGINFDIRFVVGDQDLLAPIPQVQALASYLGYVEYTGIIIVKNCGHSVPMESPRLWRQSVLDFIQ